MGYINLLFVREFCICDYFLGLIYYVRVIIGLVVNYIGGIVWDIIILFYLENMFVCILMIIYFFLFLLKIFN